MTSLLVVLLLTVNGAQTLPQPQAAEPALPAPSAPIGPGLNQPSPSQPYEKLFENAVAEARREERRHAQFDRATGAPTGRKVVCGMVVVQVDPNVDAKMVQRPADPATTLHIKKIPPAACAE